MSNFLSNVLKIIALILLLTMSSFFFITILCITIIGLLVFKINAWFRKRDFSGRDYVKNKWQSAQHTNANMSERFNHAFNRRIKRFQNKNQTFDISDGEFKQDK